MKRLCLLVALLLCLFGCSDQAGDPPDSSPVVSETTVTPRTPGELLIKNVSLIDGTGAGIQENVDILIADGQIIKIGSGLDVESATQTIDGSGKYVIPGLIDTHVHLDAPIVFQLNAEEKKQIIDHTPLAFLYNGVTTVLNVSSDVDWIFEQRQAEREGTLLSPRIYAMGRSLTPKDGWGSRHGGALVTPEDARERALDYVSRNTDGFKVIIEDGLGASGTYKRMSEDMMKAISDVAAEHNVPIYTHAINLDEFHSAVELGSTAIIHGLEDAIPEGDSLLEDMRDNNVAFVPTQSLWEAFLRHDDAAADLNDPVLRASVPHFLLDYMQNDDYRAEETRRFLAVANMPVYKWAEEKIPIFMENIRLAHEAGILLSTGTDAGGPVGFNFQRYNTPWEVKLLVQAGLSPMDALVAATKNGAVVIGVDNELGTVEEGKLADLLILSANPLEDIENIRNIDTVLYKGKAYPRQEFAYAASDPE